MIRLSTLTGRQFQYKEHPDQELIIYPPDREGTLQERSAIAITPFTINLVKRAIKEAAEIAMGASRDKPPRNSLGALVKREKQSPQQLSYLIPILIDSGYCESRQIGKAFYVKYIRS